MAGKEATDAELCAAFERVDQARDAIPLTYFEFGTLAALLLFKEAAPDVVILEVGLGGRLDAVNLVDADVALISSVGIDHTDWLGPDRESIGLEKAGIFRADRPAVYAERNPPASVLLWANNLCVDLNRLGESYDFEEDRSNGTWDWTGKGGVIKALPLPALKGRIQLQNAAASIACLRLLESRVPVKVESIHQGLRQVRLPGRFQTMAGDIPVILDVAHNAEACSVLADNLASAAPEGRTLAVLGMLRDKPARAVAEVMDAQVHAWYLGGLPVAERGQDAESLKTALGEVQAPVACYPDVAQAFAAARREALPSDRIIVFGSFHTVEMVLRIAK